MDLARALGDLARSAASHPYSCFCTKVSVRSRCGATGRGSFALPAVFGASCIRGPATVGRQRAQRRKSGRSTSCIHRRTTFCPRSCGQSASIARPIRRGWSATATAHRLRCFTRRHFPTASPASLRWPRMYSSKTCRSKALRAPAKRISQLPIRRGQASGLSLRAITTIPTRLSGDGTTSGSTRRFAAGISKPC